MAVDSRRCTASQLFMEEEQKEAEGMSTYDRVVELINQATLMNRDAQKISYLKQVQELIIHKEADLLDNFLDEMLAFQSDKSVEVKKFVIGFMEESCKKDNEILPKVVGSLIILLRDESVAVMKKVILAMSGIYKTALKWISKAKVISDVVTQTWQVVNQMKLQIIDMLDSDNDGIRTHVVKFIESLIITLSPKTPDSEVPKKSEGEMTVDDIPDRNELLRPKKLEEEGMKAFQIMLDFQGSSHISSVNLMACMGSMTSIAKQRPQFMTRVVQSFETLHVNLPPTLAKSQVSSVRKNLKMQLLILLKHPACFDYKNQVSTLLTDLGATQAEVLKAMPKVDESKKRKAEEEEKEDIPVFTKKPKTIPVQGESDKQTAIDISAEDLVGKLTPQNVADLVLLSMVMLPETMPVQFQATYTPIAAAGTQAQIKHLGRLLATQLTAAGLGVGVEQMKLRGAEIVVEEEAESSAQGDDGGTSPKHTIQTVVGGTVAVPQETLSKIMNPTLQSLLPMSQTVSSRKGVKVFKLSTVTKPLDKNVIEHMTIEAFKRVLYAERISLQANAFPARMKSLASMVTLFGGSLRTVLLDFILEDLRNRADIAFAWLYQEYASYQGYNVLNPGAEKPTIAGYDECLTSLLTGLLERPDQREGLFSRLMLEAPLITPNAIQVLRKYCQDETRIYLGMTTLKELIVKRPNRKLEFLDVLLDFASHDRPEVRGSAMRVVKKLHEREELQDPIERYALYNLKLLLQPKPPAELFSSNRGKLEATEIWTEEITKMCLYVYLGLMPIKHSLIHELAFVYTSTTPDVKRTILRVVEGPVKGMGMDSPELLQLVEHCPKGSETLVTRVIHILTDKAAPSPELVERVRDLYVKRVSDVRFLIPVLNGLSKKEVIGALPKLIKLNPVVVKEVFNRLLGTNVESGTSYTSPLTPAELLIALHNIDTTKCDMKTVIKATNLCFAEKTIYSQEVLAVVMQQLMDQSPLPTLLMRTVIQSLTMYPRLIGFVLNILQRLITKQVWKQKKVWEGFVRCCQRTKPQSFQVLLQLPAPQLKSCFEIAPDVRDPLLAHVQSFTPHQRAHIPKAIMAVLEKDPLEDQKAVEKAKKEQEERDRIYQMKIEEERQKQQRLALERQKLKEEQEKQEELINASTAVKKIPSTSSPVIKIKAIPITSISKSPVQTFPPEKQELKTLSQGEKTEDGSTDTSTPKQSGNKEVTPEPMDE